MKKFSGRDAVLRVHNRKRKADAEHRVPTRSDPLETLKWNFLVFAGKNLEYGWNSLRGRIGLGPQFTFREDSRSLAFVRCRPFPVLTLVPLLGPSKLGKRTLIPTSYGIADVLRRFLKREWRFSPCSLFRNPGPRFSGFCVR